MPGSKEHEMYVCPSYTLLFTSITVSDHFITRHSAKLQQMSRSFGSLAGKGCLDVDESCLTGRFIGHAISKTVETSSHEIIMGRQTPDVPAAGGGAGQAPLLHGCDCVAPFEAAHAVPPFATAVLTA